MIGGEVLERALEVLRLWLASGAILIPAWGPFEAPPAPPPDPSPPPITLSLEAAASDALSAEQVYSLALDASGSAAWADRFVSVSWCESSWQPWRTGAAGEAGLAQIHPVHAEWIADELGIAWADLYDPATNVRVAFVLWTKAGGWGPWSCA